MAVFGKEQKTSFSLPVIEEEDKAEPFKSSFIELSPIPSPTKQQQKKSNQNQRTTLSESRKPLLTMQSQQANSQHPIQHSLPKVSSTSGLGDLEAIGAVQLRLMRMKKKMGQARQNENRDSYGSNDEHASAKDSKADAKEDSKKAAETGRNNSVGTTKRSKSSKKEQMAPGLPQVSERHKKYKDDQDRAMITSQSRLLEPTLAMELRKMQFERE